MGRYRTVGSASDDVNVVNYSDIVPSLTWLPLPTHLLRTPLFLVTSSDTRFIPHHRHFSTAYNHFNRFALP